MRVKGVLLCAFCLWAAQGLSAERVVCVSATPAGVPAGAQRVKTLQEGIDLSGKYKQKGDDVTLLIAGGDYTLTKTLEMTTRELGQGGGTLTVAPLNGEKVTWRGGVSVPLSMIEKAPADERIRPDMRDKIYRVDLRKAGIRSIGPIRNSGFSRPALPAWTEVFINDRAQQLSRWPNDTMALMGPVLETGSVPRVGDMGNKGGTFSYYDDRPAAWKSAPKWIAGYFAYGYADDMVRIASVDTLKKTITLAEAVMYGLISGQDYNRWYVVNLLEEVDRPGEYYLDEENLVLWVYPSEEIHTLSLSLLSEPMVALEGVSDVEIRNIDFNVSRGMGAYLERTENVTLRGCTFRNLGATAVCIGRGVEAQKQYGHSFAGKPISRMLGSLAQHYYDDTGFDREGGHNNGLIDCVIQDVGAGGVNLGGGNRRTLEAAGNYVQNCRISNYNRVERSYRPAILIMGVGNRISHCEIFNAPSSAIMLHGNDHLIEYNDIHHVCQEVDDLGAVYYGRDPSEQGNRLMYNYVHHLSAKHRVTAFYHDDGACGMYCYGNIFFQAGLQPVLLGGGSDNCYDNNIIIGTPYGLYVDNRLENWCGTPEMLALYRHRLEVVGFLDSPFKDRYPLASRYFEDGFQIPKRNTVRNTLFYDISKLLVCPGERPYERAYMEMLGCWVTWSGKGFEDPGFVDAAAENWNLKPDAAVFRNIPGFKPIPFDEIGCSLPK